MSEGIPAVGECSQVDVKTDLGDMNKQCKIYMARSKPVLFKKAAAEWPCATKWCAPICLHLGRSERPGVRDKHTINDAPLVCRKLDWFRESPVGDVVIDVSLDGKVQLFLTWVDRLFSS
jgi:hypothetical protein